MTAQQPQGDANDPAPVPQGGSDAQERSEGVFLDRTANLYIGGYPLAKFPYEQMHINVTRHSVVINAKCQDTTVDQVQFNPDTLEMLGYQRDLTDIQPLRWWQRWGRR
ncbi:hypothetical protein DSM43518_02048 [Mycobacterium marinum]|nr:hypothetical protein DSM43518_02048 [Mycobacterium marinum]